MKTTASLVASFRFLFRPLCVSAATCLLFGTPAPTRAADAEDAVRAFLAKRGLTEGYDAENNRFVYIGDSVQEVSNLSDPEFLKKRENAFLAAVFSAKKEIIGSIERRLSVEDSVRVEEKDGHTEQTTTSIVDVFSKRLVRGCTVLHAEESFEAGLYRTAVAVVWSEKLERAALAAMAGAGPEMQPADADAEWAAWINRTDFARRIGPAQFTDSHGVYRYAGIGCSDIEGKKGRALIDARKMAEKKAEQALVYSLWADTVAHDCAVSILREHSTGSEEESEAMEDFMSQVAQKCSDRHVKKLKVFAGTVTNPLSGRKMFVYVAGMDPDVLADLAAEPEGGN